MTLNFVCGKDKDEIKDNKKSIHHRRPCIVVIQLEYNLDILMLLSLHLYTYVDVGDYQDEMKSCDPVL